MADPGTDQQPGQQFFVPHVDAPTAGDVTAADEVPRITRSRRSGSVPAGAATTSEPKDPALERRTSTARWPVVVGPIGSGGATFGVLAILAGAPPALAGAAIALGAAMAVAALIVAYR